METYNDALAGQFGRLLAQRAAELRELLHAGTAIDQRDGETAAGEVADFKDFASEQSRAVVDDAQASRAVRELELVTAARHRLDQQVFGVCLGCGQAIDLRRLTALPATPYCSACQADHEKRPV